MDSKNSITTEAVAATPCMSRCMNQELPLKSELASSVGWLGRRENEKPLASRRSSGACRSCCERLAKEPQKEERRKASGDE